MTVGSATHAQPHPSRAQIVAAFLALYLIWGSTYLFIKFAVADIPPFLAAVVRHGTAGALLYAYARARGARRPTARQWGVAALVGALLLAAGNGMVNWAAQRVPSGLSALLVSSVPVWIVTVDWLRPRGVRPTTRTILGLALGSLGVAGLVWSAGGIESSGAGQTTSVMMIIASVGLVLGSLAWATGSILSRQLPRHSDGLLATSMEMLTASAILVPVTWIAGDFAGFDPAAVSARAWASLGYLIVAGSLIGFTAYNWLLRVSTPAKVATYAYVNPVVAVAMGWAFAGERLTRSTLGAALLVLGAVAIITIPARQALREPSGDR